jgi:ATP-dependent RNA helicase DDX55/SPB4
LVEFLKLRGVPLSELPSIDSKITKQQVYEYLIDQNKSDRDLFDKSTKAFVSWIRSYKEHQAHYIFQFKNVDLGALGHAFGLLKIPSMPELKTQTMNYTPPSIDLNQLAYKDKQREKQRLLKLNAPAPPVEKKHIKSSAPWSKKKEMKEKRLERREKKAKRKTAILEAKKAGTFKKRSAEEVKEEWDELQKEARKIKKGKRGKQADWSSDSSDFSSDE